MKRPIRVLQIVTKMDQGGLECRLMDIYRNIDRTQVQFDFYTCRQECGYFDDEITLLGGKIFYEAPLSLKNYWLLPVRFKRFLLAHPAYKIVHCHLNQWCGPVLKGAKQAGVPVRIAHARTALNKLSVRNCVKNTIKHTTNQYATHRFAVSRKAAQWLYGKRAIRAGAVKIWPNAIDCHRFRFDASKREQMRERLSLGNAFTIVHVGSFRPEKNHIFLLKVFHNLQAKDPSAVLLLIGDGDGRAKLEAQVHALKLDQAVRFLGKRTDVADILQAGDVFVFPSFYEGFPGAVLEAQAAGLPCVVSDTITPEICLTPEVKMLSLKQNAEVWADTILSVKGAQRNDNYQLLCDAGYNIGMAAKELERFYLAQNDALNRYNAE